jgi:hypothetical protein
MARFVLLALSAVFSLSLLVAIRFLQSWLQA